jgi:3-oxoacyl-[acyl-carrier-protein] synthase II
MPPSDLQPGVPIVISATGMATSLGLDAASTLAAIRAGRIGLGAMPAMESPLPDGSLGGQALDLPATFAPGLPREIRALRWVISQAITAAFPSQRGNPYAPRRCALILGTTLHGIRAGGRFLRTDNPGELIYFLASSVARKASEGLGLEGACMTTCSACSSSLGAIALGATLLESGQFDLVIAGGYDAVSEYAWAGFNALRLVAPDAVRPFATQRKGMMLAEGYAVVALERATDAAARGHAPIAQLSGWGESADAHHLTQPEPNGTGASRAMHDALRRARTSPAAISMIAAHATATPDNDAAEFAAYSSVFQSHLSSTPTIGFKSYLGHTLGGAGAVELLLSAGTLHSGWIPPIANVAAEDVQFPALCVAPPTGLERPVTRTLNTSLGFGGANTCVILEHPEAVTAPTPRPAPVRPPEVWITGIGVLLPGINGLDECIARLAHTPGEIVPRGNAAMVTDEQLASIMSVRRMRRMSACVKLMLASVTLAIRNARLEGDAARLNGACAMLGSAHGSSGFCCDYYTSIVRDGGVLGANPVLFAEGVPNAAAAHVSTTFGIRGSCQTIIGSRTAGLDALALATMRIRTGASDLIIVGAAEETHDVVARAYRHQGLYSSLTADDQAFLTPGSVAFTLESAASASARGATPLAIIDRFASASGMQADAHPNVPLSSFRAASTALKAVHAGGRVLGSGNGTWIDRAEAAAIRHVDGAILEPSLFARTGDLFAAAALLHMAHTIATAPGQHASALATDLSGIASALSFRTCTPQMQST